MCRSRSLPAVVLACSLVLCANRPAPAAARYAICSGGLPTITGDLGGSVSGSSIITSPLTVTVNFGELSPANPNGIVRVAVPVTIRSSDAYQVSVSVMGGVSGDPNAVQLSDIGFGVQNLRRLAAGKNCNDSAQTISVPFDNDPSVTVNRSGRASYPSSLADVGTSTVILMGPRLSAAADVAQADNGWAFDAIFAVVPQYFAPGSFTLTVTFTIGAASCSCAC